MKQAFVISALILTAGTALAAEVHETRPVACLDYSIAKLTDGSSVGMCEGKKGKKSRLLRGFAVAKVVNPETGFAAQVLVGFP